MLIAEFLLAKALVVAVALPLSLASGLLLSAALRPFAPPALAEALAAGFAARLDRRDRPAAALAWRGGAVTVLLGLTGFGLGAAVEHAALLAADGWVLLPLALALCLSPIRPVANGRAVLAALEARSPALAPDQRRILSAQSIEQAASGLNAGLVAPVFWYCLLGLPGVGLYIAWTALDRAVAAQSGGRSRFARIPQQCAVLVNLAPLWLSGLGLLAASFLVPRCSPIAALSALGRAVFRPGWIIADPAIAVVAGATGTQLANRRAQAATGWNFAVGADSAPPMAVQLRLALALYGVAAVQALLGFLLTVHLAARFS